ncbi:FAD-binding oxidoreductase [Nocardioides marmoribigeumensis]|uniref:FAD/FMN-containing dehydrogenase n=1 Tax=Nocardioides marmoribigeumensis TaxID=433649 RepID=A0ABU2BTF3_9ACTN|nr:FAD-binding protein [Nocardioides marmoribigeumensis]MDR7361907.1 FAD/FMN-containing dehydrogenase [Nocardioides marmoribigeumensis]
MVTSGTWGDERLSRRGALLLGGAAALAGCTTDAPVGRSAAVRASTTVRARDWSWLRAHVAGTLARPGDASYDRVRKVQIADYDGARPLAVLSVASAADVATGIRFARDHDVPVALRSGGHSYPGWSAGDGRLVIDVRPLSRVRLEQVGGSVHATVGAGAPLIKVYDALAQQRRGLPAGSCPTVGITGLTLGGGQGILSRLHGLTCDALTQVRMVTASGDVVVASARRNPGLFWALRGGGGGHLGVVTSLTFDTFAAPTVSTAYLQWRLDDAPDVLRAWESWAPSADRRLWSTAKGLGGERHPDGPVLAVAVVWAGPDDGLTRRLDHLLADVPRPTSVSRRRRSFADVTRAYAGCSGIPVDRCHTGPGGALEREHFAGTSHVAYARSSSSGRTTLVDRLEAAQGSGLIEAGISLDSLGGAVADPAPGDTAFVHRRALATVQYTATHHPGDRSTALAFVRGARAAMTPTWGDHAYVNYADAALRHYRRAYFGTNASRLATVRHGWDPDGFFTQPQGF